MLDLEDAVPLVDKEAASEAIWSHWTSLVATGIPLVVRINAEGSAFWTDDLSFPVFGT
nr:aldolase/citrate lyase family protein [Bradyrhizobium tropiciagri]